MSKYVKKGYMEMGEQLYLEPWKSVLGRSILHYSRDLDSQMTKATLYCGFEFVTYKEPQLWQQLTAKIKRSSSLESFKQNIKLWKDLKCPYRAWKTYMNEWMNEWMDEWINEWMDGWMLINDDKKICIEVFCKKSTLT